MSIWRKAMAFAAAGLLAAGVAGAGTVSAQDASPVPTPAECVAPDLPPGTPTPQDDMSMPASPEAMPMEEATPPAETTEEAAPAEAPAGTAAEGADADAIIAAVTNAFNCGAAGDFEGLAALMTTDFMVNTFGTGNPYDVALFMEGTVWSDFSASNPMTYEDGSVSADVQYMSSEYQLSSERWHLVDEDGTWKISGLEFTTADIDLDSAVVGVTLTETTDDAGAKTYAFELGRPSNPQSEALIFHIVNNGSEVHEMVLVQLPEGADPAGILDGSIAESDVKFIGSIAPILPGQQADMTLIGLEPGVYTLVCFFPGPDGAPHAANGMVAQFEVTAAS